MENELKVLFDIQKLIAAVGSQCIAGSYIQHPFWHLLYHFSGIPVGCTDKEGNYYSAWPPGSTDKNPLG